MCPISGAGCALRTSAWGCNLLSQTTSHNQKLSGGGFPYVIAAVVTTFSFMRDKTIAGKNVPVLRRKKRQARNASRSGEIGFGHNSVIFCHGRKNSLGSGFSAKKNSYECVGKRVHRPGCGCKKALLQKYNEKGSGLHERQYAHWHQGNFYLGAVAGFVRIGLTNRVCRILGWQT